MSLFHVSSGSVSGWFGGSSRIGGELRNDGAGRFIRGWLDGKMGLRASLPALNTDLGLIPE